MVQVNTKYLEGATPLDPSEAAELIPDYISTQSELNTLEQANIADAYLWAKRAKLDDILTATFIFNLHKRMFRNVWKWAGKQRSSNKNIGVSKERMMQELGVLLTDVEYWIQHKTFSTDEIAVRFHQRLVLIHIFPNGNGRHSRLITNLLLKKLGQPGFTWGSDEGPTLLEVEGKTRKTYVASLKEADAGDYRSLLKFVRS
jgi:Fic-DOC domain mobile mystery protein B